MVARRGVLPAGISGWQAAIGLPGTTQGDARAAGAIQGAARLWLHAGLLGAANAPQRIADAPKARLNRFGTRLPVPPGEGGGVRRVPAGCRANPRAGSAAGSVDAPLSAARDRAARCVA